MGEISRAIVWVKDEPFGVELAEIRLASDRVSANGVAVRTAPCPYRLDYELETGPGFVTARFYARSSGIGWHRRLDLRRGEDDSWEIDAEEAGDVGLPPSGGDPAALDDAVDCDLALSPVTNLMPILRHGLLSGSGPLELTAAWVAVPELSVQPDRQRYTYVGSSIDHHVVRYEAIDGTFTAEITVDRDGLVIDYPGIARRVSGGPVHDSGSARPPADDRG